VELVNRRTEKVLSLGLISLIVEVLKSLVKFLTFELYLHHRRYFSNAINLSCQ